MNNKSQFTRSFFIFLIGIGIGSLATFWFLPETLIRLNGVIIVDSLSDRNLYLNGASYIDNPKIADRVYLKFRDNSIKHPPYGQTATVIGRLKNVDIGEGQVVTELEVLKVE